MRDGDLFFAFELARELHIADPRAMLKAMPARLFTQWRAFHKAENILIKQAREEAKNNPNG